MAHDGRVAPERARGLAAAPELAFCWPERAWRSCSSRKESYSPEAGSLLNWLPFITSIGGSNLWIARAITDFAAPREPEMTTPPPLAEAAWLPEIVT